MARCLVIPFIGLLITSAAVAKHAPKTFADIRCSAEADVAGGKVTVFRWLRKDGVLSGTVVLWVPKSATALRISGRWEAHSPEVIHFDRGLVMFDQTFLDGEQRRGAHLELRATGGPHWDGDARLQGRFHLQQGVRLSADWADVLAMARGAGQLSIVLVDRHEVAISAQELDRSTFEGFVPDAERLLSVTAEMAADPQHRCASPSSDIVVD